MLYTKLIVSYIYVTHKLTTLLLYLFLILIKHTIKSIPQFFLLVSTNQRQVKHHNTTNLHMRKNGRDEVVDTKSSIHINYGYRNGLGYRYTGFAPTTTLKNYTVILANERY